MIPTNITLAATGTKIPGSIFGMPEQASTIAESIDRVYDIVNWICVFFFVVIVVVMVVRAMIQSDVEEDETEDTSSTIMVQDPNCKTYVPKTEAVRKEIRETEYFFCSEKCAEEYEQKA